MQLKIEYTLKPHLFVDEKEIHLFVDEKEIHLFVDEKEKNIIKFKNSCLIIKEIVNVLMGDFNTTMIISFTI